MHVEAGSSLTLKCTVGDYLIRPTYIFWYQDNNRLVGGLANGVSVEDNIDAAHDLKENSARDYFQPLFSILTLKGEANRKLSGRYSCVPDNLRPTSINVHVIFGT